MDTCPHCHGPTQETYAVTNGRRALLRCRGHTHWFPSSERISKRELFDRREKELREKQT